MATFFTADLHFNHKNIIQYCDRRDSRGLFKHVEDMNEWIIRKWNDTVLSERDIVWVLGDFAYPSGQGTSALELFHRLRGIKNFVVGNHDEKNKSHTLDLPWENKVKAVRGGFVLPHIVTYRDNQRRAELSHYPLETWKNAHRGALMFHGHCHGSLKRIVSHRFDVGIDVWKRPMDFEDLWEISTQQKYRPADHHT